MCVLFVADANTKGRLCVKSGELFSLDVTSLSRCCDFLEQLSSSPMTTTDYVYDGEEETAAAPCASFLLCVLLGNDLERKRDASG